MSKICSHCHRELNDECFGKCKNTPDGLRKVCKECRKIEYINNREKAIEKSKQYYNQNREKVLVYHKQYYEKNKDKIQQYNQDHYKHKQELRKIREEKYKDEYSERRRKNYLKNKEHFDEINKRYRESHKEEVAQRSAEYRQNNPQIIKAQNYVKNAITSQKLVRFGFCEGCYQECKPQAHHFSYKENHYGDVIWLCASCHRQLHYDITYPYTFSDDETEIANVKQSIYQYFNERRMDKYE